MHRFFTRVVQVFALSLLASGCGSGTDTTTTAPTPTTLTDTFIGTLTLNGSAAFPFTVTGSGNITAQLTSLAPDAARPVGISLGTWNGSICQIVLDLPAAIQGSLVVGTTSTTGSFCVRIYDSAGTVVQPENYVIDVSHQ